MSTVQKTLNECLDEAVATMPLFRRLAWSTRLSIPAFRRRTQAELRERLYDDERSAGQVITTQMEGVETSASVTLGTALASDSFTADTPFAIDIDKLRELLKLILEFLPLILKLFSGFGAILLAVILLPASADAQLFSRLRGYQSQSSGGCPGGICPTQQSSDSAVGRWKNYDGLSGREHARRVHHIDVSGMSNSQVAQLRDQDHDRYGSGHPAVLASLPNRGGQIHSTVRSVANSTAVPAVRHVANSVVGTRNSRPAMQGPSVSVASVVLIPEKKVGWL